jgi:hypothetical protein
MQEFFSSAIRSDIVIARLSVKRTRKERRFPVRRFFPDFLTHRSRLGVVESHIVLEDASRAGPIDNQQFWHAAPDVPRRSCPASGFGSAHHGQTGVRRDRLPLSGRRIPPIPRTFLAVMHPLVRQRSSAPVQLLETTCADELQTSREIVEAAGKSAEFAIFLKKIGGGGGSRIRT